MASNAYSLAIAELVIYIILILAVGYILLRHGKPGWDAWGFLGIFCILRIVAAGLQIGAGPDGVSVTAAIVNSIGVLGLLMGVSGILLECSRCNPRNNPKMARMVASVFHIAAVVGTVLAAVGGSDQASAISSGKPVPSDAHTKQVAGYAILTVGVLFLTLYALYQLVRIRSVSGSGGAGGSAAVLARRLLYCVLMALPFVIVRVLYSLVAAASQIPSLSIFSGSFVVHLVLITLVQLVVVLFLIAGGLLSVGIHQVMPPAHDDGAGGDSRRGGSGHASRFEMVSSNGHSPNRIAKQEGIDRPGRRGGRRERHQGRRQERRAGRHY
ncbi:hypothetical protein Micbo1qcDRAFT_235823 [Microdochium bolleyi]|uniref:DUF7702 domain-containing protein n=1 Tax=Microdochium bolleyi TaxID=196109 RepID=A0A136IUE3_9PEZI|nr:hypothetical protein Micbo1qcDRAFT_235823 [Microdochium bolleyi]